MKHSTDRILTTHVGSMPRPPELRAMLDAKQALEPYDEAAMATLVKESVANIVRAASGRGPGHHQRRRAVQDRLVGLHPGPAQRLRVP